MARDQGMSGWDVLNSSLNWRAASPITVNCHESAAIAAQRSSLLVTS
jgi:hypothetical protein